jgi:guanidinobutyrase
VRSCSGEEAEFARKAGIRGFSTGELVEDLRSVVEEVKKGAGSAPVYLSIDLDVLDPAFAPGVATPEPGGLSTGELLRVIREFKGLNLQGCDVVELTPPHDDGTTAFVAARIAYEVLGLLASERKSIPGDKG